MADINMRILLSAVGGQSVISSISSIGSSLGKGGLGGVLLGVTAAVGAAAVGVGVASVKMAADYQQSMNRVQALTGSSNQQMQQYDSSLKSLAVNAGVAPKALSDGLYNVLSAGYSGAAAMRVLTLATEDSKIGMTDAATTTNALTNVMANFKVGASQANIVNGEMLQTVTMGKATFQQYASSITKAASTSAQYGQTMETMNAAWATLTASGISAGMATTDYDQSLKVMDGNIGTVVKSLQKNGIAFNETKFNAMSYGQQVVYMNNALQEARDKHVSITGATAQASQAISTIAGHIGMYNNDLSQLSNKQAMANKTQQAWAITQSGFSQQMSRVNAAGQVLMITIGQALLPALTKIAAAAVPIISNFTTWLIKSGALQNGVAALATGITMAIGVIGRLVSIGASVVGFFQHNQLAMDALKAVLVGLAAGILAFAATTVPAMVAAFGAWAISAGAAAIATLAAAAPFIIIGAVVAVVVIGIILAIQHWGQISAWLQGVWAAVLNWIISAWSSIVSFFSGIWHGIQGAFSSVGSWFSNLFNQAINGIKSAWNGVTSFFTGIWKGIQGAFGSVGQWFQDRFKQAQNGMKSGWDNVTSTIHGVGQNIGNTFMGAAQNVVKAHQWMMDHNYYYHDAVVAIQNWTSQAKSFVTTQWQNIQNGIANAWNAIKSAFSSAISWLTGLATTFWSGEVRGWTNIWNAIKSVVTSLWNDVRSAFNSAFSFLSGLALTFWNGEVKGWTNIWNAVKGVVTSLWNDVSSAFSSAFNFIAGIATTFWNDEVQGWTNIYNRVVSVVSSMWSNVTSTFSNAWGSISGALSGLWSSISGWFSNLGNQALQWGENVVNMLAQGIMNAAGAVGNAVSSVASKITSVLGFHSPPESGPAADSDTWMPNMMRMLATGMLGSLPTLQSAINTTAGTIASGLNNLSGNTRVGVSALPGSGTAASAGVGNVPTSTQTTQNINLTLNINAQKLDESEMEEVAKYTVTYFGDQIRSQFGSIAI